MKSMFASLLAAVVFMGTACLASPDVRTPTQVSAATAACKAQQASAPPPPVTPAVSTEYVIGVADTVHISFSPDVGRTICSGDYTVLADGNINFCIGTVKVDGLTERLAQELVKKTSTDQSFVTNPNVTVEVKSFRSQSVFVNGEVGKPGEVKIAGGPNELTLMNVIASAGNLKGDSAGPDIFVLRKAGSTLPISENDPTAERTKYSRKWMNESMVNPSVRPGDTVWVPPAQYFQIVGEVKNAGRQTWEPCMTVAEAVAKAGGQTDKASLGRSYVQRKDPKTGRFVQVDIKNRLEFLIEPNDIVTIGKRLM